MLCMYISEQLLNPSESRLRLSRETKRMPPGIACLVDNSL